MTYARTLMAIYEECGTYLGRGLSILIDILNPQIIILGSIYGRATALLENAMRRSLMREALNHSYEQCRIVPAGLGERIGDVAALSIAAIAAEARQELRVKSKYHLLSKG